MSLAKVRVTLAQCLGCGPQAGLLTNQNLRGGLSSYPGRQPWDKVKILVKIPTYGCGFHTNRQLLNTSWVSYNST